ncbi:hypothetical protein ACROYT_G009512 [Oculina patagonica]
MIRREAFEPDESPQEFVEDLHARLRVRRESPIPQPELSNYSLATYDTYFMYWPRNSGSENVVFLLGKNTKTGSDKSTSAVFVSRNYGKNFTRQNFSLIDQIYYGKADPKLCILADKVNKILYRTEDLVNFLPSKIIWQPSYLTFHPSDRRFVMGYDAPAEKLYWSKDAGKKFTLVPGEVKSFNWGDKDLDSRPDVIFVEKYQKPLQERLRTRDNRTAVYKVTSEGSTSLAANVEEFEMMKNYMFITTRNNPKDKTPILKVAQNRSSFKEATFPSNEESRDFFVFDVIENHVFVVINHLRNLSNMYVSDHTGIKYQLSLPRVLYHNPFTNVSSPWLRTVIPYAFVDVDKIQSMRGIYVATQLTPGPVGKRHLLSLITYNRGATWQRIRSPTVDNRGVRINCLLPSCSLHLNLLYGAVYRVSPSERLLSSTSAPGLVLALGVASTNLKIYPDLFLSLDGGLGWNRVLRGKYLFTFGDHGGVIIAVPYRRYTKALRYSTDGGFTWETYIFSTTAILARDIVTQPGERLPIFLIYGNRARAWTVFYLNMTNVLGPVCDSSGFTTFTDGCLLGRQQQFETRNWTILCHAGRDYKRPSFVKNCPCSRIDFQCDYGFERKNIDEECTPINSEDLDNEIIPENCPEGTNYSRTQGFRKIEGDTCVNGSQKDFLPVDTPCPVKELLNLTLRGVGSNVTEDGGVAVQTGGTVSFFTNLTKGYQPNIMYRWFWGDGHGDQGMGAKFASQKHQYHKPGKYIVSVVASNTQSILVQRLEVYVQEKLTDERVVINFNPKDPGVDEDVIFHANLNYSNIEAGAVHYKWKFDEGEVQGWQPVATLRFHKAKSYVVQITAANYLNSVKKSVKVKVLKDLTPVNVTASVIGPTQIKVTWKHVGQADKLITGHKVYKSTLGSSGFQQTSCAVTTTTTCTVGNLSPATTYYFKVKASTKDQESAFSNVAFAMTNVTTPGGPENPSATVLNSSAIRVEWKAPARPSGRITSYTIRYWSHNDHGNVHTVNNGLSLSRDIAGLQQDTVYFFEVYANSDSGRSISAGPVQALTQLSKPTLPPREIKKVSDNGTCAILQWKPPFISKTDQRSFPAKGYKVQRKDGSILDIPTNFAVVCKLTPGAQHVLKIWAYSDAGKGPFATINVTTQVIKPGAPQNVRAVAISYKQITIRWDPPKQSSGTLTGYEIYQLSPVKDKPYSVPAGKTSYTIGELEAFTTYKFVVYAKNSLGSSVKSDAVTAKTPETTPGIVQYVTTETVPPLSASIKVTWSTPKPTNGIIKQYKIKWGKAIIEDPLNTDNFKIMTVDGSTTAYTFKHLFSNTYYSFVVTPVNGAGDGLQHISPKKQRTETGKY